MQRNVQTSEKISGIGPIQRRNEAMFDGRVWPCNDSLTLFTKRLTHYGGTAALSKSVLVRDMLSSIGALPSQADRGAASLGDHNSEDICE